MEEKGREKGLGGERGIEDPRMSLRYVSKKEGSEGKKTPEFKNQMKGLHMETETVKEIFLASQSTVFTLLRNV